jgi:dynein heavy chain
MDPVTHDWSDGLISSCVRDCAELDGSSLQWIVFDGPVDTLWIESMNTVMDDNKKLCLTSGEIIKLTPVMTMVFETDGLTGASPATVSRCGMIYMEAEDCLLYRSLVHTWLEDILPIYDTENAREYINSLFEAFVHPVAEYYTNDCIGTRPLNLVMKNFLRLLDCLLLGSETRSSMTDKIKAEN